MSSVSRHPVTISRAKKEDIHALVTLEADCFGKGPYRDHQFDAAQYLYYIHKPKALVLVARDHTGLIGSVTATAGTNTRAHVGRIINLAVHTTRRLQGVGNRLLQRAIRWLKQQGCQRVFLEVAQRSQAANHFFTNAQFRPARTLPDYYSQGNHGLRMMRTLD